MADYDLDCETEREVSIAFRLTSPFGHCLIVTLGVPMAQVATRSAETFPWGMRIAFEQASRDANASKSYGSFILLTAVGRCRFSRRRGCRPEACALKDIGNDGFLMCLRSG
jgi:hypothetical protein